MKILTNAQISALPPTAYWSESGETVTTIAVLEFLANRGENISQALIDEISNMDEISPVSDEGIYDNLYSYPIFKDIEQESLQAGKAVTTLVVNGYYFSPQNTFKFEPELPVTIEKFSIERVQLNVDTRSITSNQTVTFFINSDPVADILVENIPWIDFRLGGSSIGTAEVEAIAPSNIIRDADGVGVNTTNSGWGKLLAYPSINVARTHNLGVSIVYHIQDTGTGMFGMIATSHGVDSSMYNETHIGFYINSRTTFWGFYSYANQSGSADISDYNRIKVVFPTTISPGSNWILYGLSDQDSFDDGTFLAEGVSPPGIPDAGNLIYPCLTPNTGITARLQAFLPRAS